MSKFDNAKVTYYWSRIPGKFVNSRTGQAYRSPNQQGPKFTGTVREWYETLIETIRDVANELPGQHDCAIFVPRESVGTTRIIIESSVLFRPSLDQFSVGTLGDIIIHETDLISDDEIIITVDSGNLPMEGGNPLPTFGKVKILDMNIV